MKTSNNHCTQGCLAKNKGRVGNPALTDYNPITHGKTSEAIELPNELDTNSTQIYSRLVLSLKPFRFDADTMIDSLIHTISPCLRASYSLL